MIYTEEDLKQAYDMGYNEAVDDVNEYIDQESMEFSLDESYDEDYSAVEDAIMNETKSYKKTQRDNAILNKGGQYALDSFDRAAERDQRGEKTSWPHNHLRYDTKAHPSLKERLDNYKKQKNGNNIWDKANFIADRMDNAKNKLEKIK